MMHFQYFQVEPHYIKLGFSMQSCQKDIQSTFCDTVDLKKTVIAELLILTTLHLLTVSPKPLSSPICVGTWCYLASEFFPLSSISEPNEADLS